MRNLFQKILNNPLISFILWMLLLSTKSIIRNDLWGTIVEIGGALIFIASLVNWARSKKTSKSGNENNSKN